MANFNNNNKEILLNNTNDDTNKSSHNNHAFKIIPIMVRGKKAIGDKQKVCFVPLRSCCWILGSPKIKKN